MDQRTFNEINNRILRSARKYAYKFKDKNAEELAQEFWVKVLEYEKKHGEYPMNFIEKICAERVKDLIDYGERRNAYSLTSDDEERSTWYIDHGTNLETNAEIDRLIDQFPEGSPERKYLEFYFEKSGIRMSKDMTPEITRQDDGYTDSNLAKMLGFKGTNDNNWLKFRNKMRKIVSDYFGRQNN